MTEPHRPAPPENHQTRGYRRMLERVRQRLGELERSAAPRVQKAIEQARDTAVELGELSRDEAEQIAAYVRRDLQDAAHYLATTRGELREWFLFDLSLIEERLLDMFRLAADQTRLELLELEQRTLAAGAYHTGEVTGIGTLRCTGCDKLLHFHRPARIPPCAACRGTVFVRPDDST